MAKTLNFFKQTVWFIKKFKVLFYQRCKMFFSLEASFNKIKCPCGFGFIENVFKFY